MIVVVIILLDKSVFVNFILPRENAWYRL